jgi:hypothetical protein
MPAKGYYEFEGMAPSGEGRGTFRIVKDGILEHFRKTGDSARLLEGLLVPAVIESPAAVFQGLKREGQEEVLVYVGVPSDRFIRNHNIRIPCPPGRTFLVFVTLDLKVVKWRWEEADSERPGFPTDYETRFGRRLWPPD